MPRLSLIIKRFYILRPLAVISLLFFITSPRASGQDEPQRVYMYLNYLQSNADKFLIAEIKYRQDGTFMQIEDQDIDFYNLGDTSKINIGSGNTGTNGIVKFALDNDKILWDSSGATEFEAIFKGNDLYRTAEKSLAIEEIELSFVGEIVDSVNTLLVVANKKTGAGLIPVEDADIGIFVKRLFSDLPIKTGSIEGGDLALEFPTDLPGDQQGDLIVITRITESDEYGTVETIQKLNWGIPTAQVRGERPRALWSRAPLWIIIAVSVAFLAAWFHYFLSISKLLKIRKL